MSLKGARSSGAHHFSAMLNVFRGMQWFSENISWVIISIDSAGIDNIVSIHLSNVSLTDAIVLCAIVIDGLLTLFYHSVVVAVANSSCIVLGNLVY